MKILQQAQEMQGRFQKLQEELQQQTVKASSGGGMVTVEANGQGTVKSIKIDPSVVNASDVEMLEDLILSGVNQAIQAGRKVAEAEMQKATSGLGLGGLGF